MEKVLNTSPHTSPFINNFSTMGKVQLLKTTVRITAKEDRLASRVAKRLEKEDGKRVAKAEAYRRAMVAFAFQLGV